MLALKTMKFYLVPLLKTLQVVYCVVLVWEISLDEKAHCGRESICIGSEIPYSSQKG